MLGSIMHIPKTLHRHYLVGMQHGLLKQWNANRDNKAALRVPWAQKCRAEVGDPIRATWKTC